MNYVIDLIRERSEHPDDAQLALLREFFNSAEFIAALHAAGLDDVQLFLKHSPAKHSRSAVLLEPKIRRHVDVVVLTALVEPEYRVLQEELRQLASEPTTTTVAGVSFLRFEIRAGAAPESAVNIVATPIGMGIVRAAAMTARILEIWMPESLLLIGIAGGLDDDVGLGDVVVADLYSTLRDVRRRHPMEPSSHRKALQRMQRGLATRRFCP